MLFSICAIYYTLSELEAGALFENEKSRDSYGFTPQKSRQVSK